MLRCSSLGPVQIIIEGDRVRGAGEARADRIRSARRLSVALLQYPGQLLPEEKSHDGIKICVKGVGMETFARILLPSGARKEAERDAVKPGGKDDALCQERETGGPGREILEYRHRATPPVQLGPPHQVL
jgi:hypothetical protein